jgi:exodeoxyribonuclease VII small subunit
MTGKKTSDYRKLSSELDSIVAALEAADVDIEEAMRHYQRGMEIIKEIDTYLKQAENKVIKVKAAWKNS